MPNALQVPQHLTDRVTALGGLNRFGGPNFRIVWGGSRTHKVGGIFKTVIEGKVFDVPEVRELLKYHPDRWHLERWIGPEKYGSEEEWYRTTRAVREFVNDRGELCFEDIVPVIHTCGPYPSSGDY